MCSRYLNNSKQRMFREKSVWPSSLQFSIEISSVVVVGFFRYFGTAFRQNTAFLPDLSWLVTFLISRALVFQFLSLIHPHILRLLKEETVFAQKGTVMFNLFIANVSEQKLINYLGVFSFSFFFPQTHLPSLSASTLHPSEWMKDSRETCHVKAPLIQCLKGELKAEISNFSNFFFCKV